MLQTPLFGEQLVPSPTALPVYLMAGVCGAPAALRGPKAETAGAALGIGGIQGEGPKAALVTPGALHVLLAAGRQGGSADPM